MELSISAIAWHSLQCHLIIPKFILQHVHLVQNKYAQQNTGLFVVPTGRLTAICAYSTLLPYAAKKEDWSWRIEEHAAKVRCMQVYCE